MGKAKPISAILSPPQSLHKQPPRSPILQSDPQIHPQKHIMMASEQPTEDIQTPAETPAEAPVDQPTPMAVDSESSKRDHKDDDGHDSEGEGEERNRHKTSERKQKKEAEGLDSELDSSKKKIDRETTCPFLIRTFVRMNRMYERQEFIPGNLPKPEAALYAWKDTTIAELASLLGDQYPEARSRTARIIFRILAHDSLSHDAHREREASRAIQNWKPSSQDQKTLADTRFELGDFLSVGIIPNAENEGRGPPGAYGRAIDNGGPGILGAGAGGGGPGGRSAGAGMHPD
ncbi:Histone deacetylase complex subunit sap18, partial [Rhizophlyctis rosea]